MVRRILLLVNRSSGVGNADPLAERLDRLLRQHLADRADVSLRRVQTHAQAREEARIFLADTPDPSAILVGGGGGTLRAVVEAVCAMTPDVPLPGGDRLLPHLFRGAWREPLFPFSTAGRLFLREGYSAEVMRVIYEQDQRQPTLLDCAFLGYPLHRAVYDRLQILTARLEAELEARLRTGGHLTAFTAPSGCAYDLFRPLERIAARSPAAVAGVHLVAADLDPRGTLGDELRERAGRLNVRCTFLKGDLTRDDFRGRCAAEAPFDLALFVGLSSWLPKPDTLRHLRWVREHLTPEGLLVTDCFTPEAYALSGRYVGYKAHYYTPDNYRALLDYCGFDGRGAEVVSGRDRINHVFLARPPAVDPVSPP